MFDSQLQKDAGQHERDRARRRALLSVLLRQKIRPQRLRLRRRCWSAEHGWRNRIYCINIYCTFFHFVSFQCAQLRTDPQRRTSHNWPRLTSPPFWPMETTTSVLPVPRSTAPGSTVRDAVKIILHVHRWLLNVDIPWNRQSGFHGREDDGRWFVLAQELLHLHVVQQEIGVDILVRARRRNLLQKSVTLSNVLLTKWILKTFFSLKRLLRTTVWTERIRVRTRCRSLTNVWIDVCFVGARAGK